MRVNILLLSFLPVCELVLRLESLMFLDVSETFMTDKVDKGLCAGFFS